MVPFDKMSKPLMEKKRRARINNSLEQLKTLLEKHYSYNVRKRKLEKADILELSVKHIENLLTMKQEGLFHKFSPGGGTTPVAQERIIEYKEGFKDCLNKLSSYIQRTNISQEKFKLTLVDNLNALGPQSHDGHVKNGQVLPSLSLPGQSKILYPSHYFMENNMKNLQTENNQWKPSAGNTTLREESVVTQENRRGQQVLTEHIHVTSSSCPNVLHPPSSCHQQINVCWRPW